MSMHMGDSWLNQGFDGRVQEVFDPCLHPCMISDCLIMPTGAAPPRSSCAACSLPGAPAA